MNRSTGKFDFTMGKKSKIVLSFILTVFIISLVVNLPIIPYTDAYCHTAYESYLIYQFPCGFPVLSCVFSQNVKTVTLSSGYLYSGNMATPASPATSKLELSFNNPNCSSTYITSLSITGPTVTSITSWDSNPNPSSTSNSIGFSSATQDNTLPAINVTNFTFYPVALSRVAPPIVNGETYSFMVNFSDSEWISGFLIAQ